MGTFAGPSHQPFSNEWDHDQGQAEISAGEEFDRRFNERNESRGWGFNVVFDLDDLYSMGPKPGSYAADVQPAEPTGSYWARLTHAMLQSESRSRSAGEGPSSEYEAILSQYYGGVYKAKRHEWTTHLANVGDTSATSVLGLFFRCVQRASTTPSPIDFHNAQAKVRQGEFEQLAEEWRRARPRGGSLADIVAVEAYQRVIGMGKDAIPLIVRSLVTRPDHWFWALHCITGQNPVRKEHEGRLVQMAQDWIDWARTEGYRWDDLDR